MGTRVKFEDGFHENIPIDHYHAAQGISFSGFKEFLKFPAKYQTYINKTDEDTASRKRGRLLHMLVLEPELFKKDTVRIDGPLNKNPYKQIAEDAKEQGLIPVPEKLWANLHSMAEAIDKHPEAGNLIRKSEKEISGFWTDPDFNVQRKFRPDIMIREKGIIGDIKYFNDTDFKAVQRQIMRMQYHIQSGWYLDGASFLLQKKCTDFVHIFIDEEEPYGVMTYVIDEASLERANLDIRSGLHQYSVCLQNNHWPGPPTGLHTMSIPHWAFEYEGEQYV